MRKTCLRVLLLSIGWPFLGAGEVRLTVLDDQGGGPTPARIHLREGAGKVARPAGFPFWNDHFVCDGNARFELASGSYTYTIERGPEFHSIEGSFVLDGGSTNVSVRLKRLANLASEGWWSGETHVHRPLEDVELLMRAEDLQVAQVITWWNATNPWKDKGNPGTVLRGFDQNRFYHTMSGEDERDGGALLFGDLRQPLEITGGQRHFPSSVVYARQARARGAKWIDAEKPFWWDFPVWLATGVIDTVGIANNHMQRSLMYEGEAWGRPRDVAKYPPPLGNALWTLEIYYHALNGGWRLPPSAGSASGVLANPVGYNRVYVQVEGDFTYEKWRDGLLAGRSFVSNGPLLRCRANGELPGSVFQKPGPFAVTIEGRLDSRDPIKAVELVRNGVAERVTLPATVSIETSGWFLVRAITEVTNTFRFASTAPWYVEVEGRRSPAQKESAQFFINWCEDRIKTLQTREQLNPAQKEEVLAPWRSALSFWRGKQKAAD